MKRSISLSIIGIFSLLIAAGSAQSPAAANEQKLLALIKEVQAQQAQITGNQTTIEGKLAEIGNNLRVGRIFSGRSQ